MPLLTIEGGAHGPAELAQTKAMCRFLAKQVISRCTLLESRALVAQTVSER